MVHIVRCFHVTVPTSRWLCDYSPKSYIHPPDVSLTSHTTSTVFKHHHCLKYTCIPHQFMTSITPQLRSVRQIHTTTRLNCKKSTPTSSSQTGSTLTHHSSINDIIIKHSSHDLEDIHRDLHLAILEGDTDVNIKQNIRSAKEGEGEIVTQRVKDILRGVYQGDRAKLAEAITLGMCMSVVCDTDHVPFEGVTLRI